MQSKDQELAYEESLAVSLHRCHSHQETTCVEQADLTSTFLSPLVVVCKMWASEPLKMTRSNALIVNKYDGRLVVAYCLLRRDW
jgi:hypothetical protein